ncbi:GW dipeptide domain-containing protein [Bacteroidota bacterium]
MKYFLPAALLLIIVFTVIISTRDMKNPKSNLEGTHEVIVEEVIQTQAYTYLMVSENKSNYWMAVAKQPADVGDKFNYTSALEMVDFKSKELDRTFDIIYFVQDIQRNMSGQSGQDVSMPSMKKSMIPFEANNQIETPPDGISISQLFENRKKYANQTIIIMGKVVKVNDDIMGRNWVHIQDGTQSNGNYDLTLTTMETVQVGDTITFEGTVSLDKDFGSGYTYEVIIENAGLKNCP